MFERFSKIVNDLHALKKTYTDKELVRKILRSLTPEWRSKADAIQESIGITNVTIDGLRGNLKTYESTILYPYIDEQKKNGIALKASISQEHDVEDSSDKDEFGVVLKKFHKFMRKEFERKKEARRTTQMLWWFCQFGVRSPEFRAIVAGSFVGKSSKPPLCFEDKSRAATSGKSKSKSRAPTTSTEERLYYGDGSYLWFDSEEERTRFLTFFSKRVVAPPRIVLERFPELQGYDDLDAQLHQAGLWPFVSRARKEINPALIRVFYSNLRREGDVLYSLVKSTPIEFSVEQLGRIAGLPYQGDDVSQYGGEDWVLNNEGLILTELGITELIRHASGRPTIHSANPESRLLLYIVSRIIKPRKHGHTIMSGEDLKLIHAIMHSAPIIWAKFVMITITIAASTDHDHLLPYPFVVMDILERFKVTTTVGPLTKATKIWAISTQTFQKRPDNAGPATAVPRRRSATGPAEPQARANLASIADSLNRLHFKVDGMDGYLERLDEAVQRQGHAMNAYFQRINYVPRRTMARSLGKCTYRLFSVRGSAFCSIATLLRSPLSLDYPFC
ncbi:unnamed protein product [Cuscuta campestris]|uniref:Uncharacterized protein n=1 Tax=Cuscuta campestris TaxID=132261 RepID=A0A484N6K4_9ASTE|nr:unnamed protein product [Cuscuta campestris]